MDLMSPMSSAQSAFGYPAILAEVFLRDTLGYV